MFVSSGAEVPEQAVVRGPFRVGVDAVRVQQGALPAGSVVPLGAPGGDREVGPPIGHPELSEVDVAGAAAVLVQLPGGLPPSCCESRCGRRFRLGRRAGAHPLALPDALPLALDLWVGLPVVLLIAAVTWEKTPTVTAVMHAGDWLLKLLLIGAIVGGLR